MRKIDVTLGDATAIAVLLEDIAPRTCRAVWEKLPFTVRAVNGRWSGPALYAPIDLEVDREIENETTFMPPGLVVYNPRHKGLSISYGNAQFREPVGATYVTAFARLDGDFSAFLSVAGKLLVEGAKPLTFRRHEDGAVA
jgi:hypothetical protein